MENQKVRPLYLFLLVATLALLCFHFWSIYKKPVTSGIITTPQEAETIPDPGLVNPSYIQEKTLKQNNQYTTVDITYPELKNLDMKENRKIAEFFARFISEHNKVSKENMKARFDTDPENKGKDFSTLVLSDEDKYAADGGYTAVQVNDMYISLLYSYGAYQGGAHGFQNLLSYNYDVKNKKALTLSDILKDKKIEQGSVLEFLSEESRKQLLQKFAPDVEYKRSSDDLVYDKDQYEFIIQSIYDGTEPTAENFNVYTFTPDELTIYFGQYQVASYVDGIQEVKISLK